MSLPSWMNPLTLRLGRWLGRKPAPAGAEPEGSAALRRPAARAAAAPEATQALSGSELALDEARAGFVRWLLGQPARAAATSPPAPDPAAKALIAHLDAVIASDTSLASLLPRAAQVVPQLMKTLRDERYSAAEVALRISKDVVLATEVIRLANSAHRSGQQPIVDIVHAVTALGTDGLRRVIAKVVLRPIFESRSAPLSVLAAPRIWQDAEAKARLCVALAPGFAVDPLDAYLAGLLQNIGWTAALRALDGAKPAPARPETLVSHPDIAAELFLRRDALFARLVSAWQLSAGLSALADEIDVAGLAAARSPLAETLKLAERLAIHYCLQQSGALPSGPPALLAALPLQVQEAYAALDLAALSP